MTKNNGSISAAFINASEVKFYSNPINTLALNAVTNNGINKVAINTCKLFDYDLTFSTEIKTFGITDQKASGRCWIFAGLNMLRISAAEKMNLKNFELSQSYLMFYDKLEKANFFLENIIKTLNCNINSRLLMWLLQNCMEDGGQWSMFTSLVKKYGIVPNTIYPETVSSSNTNIMNTHISEKLREYAAIIRDNYKRYASIIKLKALKEKMLEEIHKILLIHNGIPPKKFYWSYNDKNCKFFQGAKKITPVHFMNKFIDIDLEKYVSLINCPTEDKPFNKNYTVNFLGNVVDGDNISYINVDMKIIKKSVIKTLKQGNPVWFGCDVGKNMSIDKGILDANVFSFDKLYGIEFNMRKNDAVQFGNSRMTHAMLITGVHEVENQVIRWKIENSWGSEKGRKGFFVMGDSWFDKYVYQVVVPGKNVDIDIYKILKMQPIELDPWDPMGSLAL